MPASRTVARMAGRAAVLAGVLLAGYGCVAEPGQTCKDGVCPPVCCQGDRDRCCCVSPGWPHKCKCEPLNPTHHDEDG